MVAGIGQRLLITRHAGREDCLTKGLANGAKGQSVEGAAVLKHQERRRRDSTTEVSGGAIGCKHDRPFLPQGTGVKVLGRNRGYQRIRLPPDIEPE